MSLSLPALFTSIDFVFGTRVSLGNPSEMLQLSQQILASTLGPEGQAFPVVLLALIIAILGAGIRSLAGRRMPSTTNHAPPPR